MEAFKRILNENKSLKILIPVLVVAIIIVVIIYAAPGNPKTPANSLIDTPVATSNSSSNVVMPPSSTSMPGEVATDFLSSTGDGTSSSQADSSLIGPPEYKGSSRGPKGLIALIQFTNVTKQVKIGDTIAGYKIKAIADDESYITLEKNNLVTVLQISPNSNNAAVTK